MREFKNKTALRIAQSRYFTLLLLNDMILLKEADNLTLEEEVSFFEIIEGYKQELNRLDKELLKLNV